MDFKACAAAMITAIPELWPSPWPGAPATRGRNEEVPGICEVPKTASMSLASRIVGPDLPQLARNAVGIPDMPRSTLKPWLSNLEVRSEEHTSELQSLMRISYAVFCLKNKKQKQL